MRALATLALLAMMSFAAQADSSCLGDALNKAPERAKTLASEVFPFKSIIELDGATPYFTIGDGSLITEEERAERIAENYLVPGDMLWPLEVLIDKETAIEYKISDNAVASFVGFLAIRCKSGTSTEVESMWFTRDAVAN